MHTSRLTRALKERLENDPSDKRVEILLKRVKKQKKRRDIARKIKKELRVNPLTPRDCILEHAELLRSGKVVALDFEWKDGRPITEVGISILGGDTHQIVVGTETYKRFNHGPITFLNDDEARDYLKSVLADADAFIIHGRTSDDYQLALWEYSLPDIPCIDTALWSEKLYTTENKPMSLVALALHYGISVRGAHCGGNDAWITAQVALAMANL